MNVMGIIFANDATTGVLTEKRTMASLPFGARYRQVDFALSNLTCAGVRHLGIILKTIQIVDTKWTQKKTKKTGVEKT